MKDVLAFAMRQTDYRDINQFCRDGCIKNKNANQPLHQTSYAEIVARRGSDETVYQLPGGAGNVNDCVAFYFSPYTAFTFAIHQGKVQVISPNGQALGLSRKGDRIFWVFEVEKLIQAGLTCFCSNFAMNSTSNNPQLIQVDSLFDVVKHVGVELFSETPMLGSVEQIGYPGSCQYFADSSRKPEWENRKAKRMAEFLVKDAVPLNLCTAIIIPDESRKHNIESILKDNGLNIPVIYNPDWFLGGY